MTRRVVLIHGPPGSGKTTLAHTLGLKVYDRDDPEWRNDEAAFRAALRHLGRDPNAQAAVIRTGRTQEARDHAAAMCQPTETVVMDTPIEECICRVKARGRGGSRGVAREVLAIRAWQDQAPPTRDTL